MIRMHSETTYPTGKPLLRVERFATHRDARRALANVLRQAHRDLDIAIVKLSHAEYLLTDVSGRFERYVRLGA